MVTTNEDELVLLEFFKQATAALGNVDSFDAPIENLSGIRQILLAKQTECLQSAVAVINDGQSATGALYTVESLKGALSKCNDETKKHSQPVLQAMEVMNDAARLAFCRLVLVSECGKLRGNQNRRALITCSDTSCIKDSDVLEFCGLCSAAVRLPMVRSYVSRGTPLYEELNLGTKSDGAGSYEAVADSPKGRLEKIQRLFFMALGYDPDFGIEELERLLCSNSSVDNSPHNNAITPPHDNHDDHQLRTTVRNMTQQMESFLLEVSASGYSDGLPVPFNDDNVTRVVSVAYSEKFIDAATGEEILTVNSNEAPRTEAIHQDSQSDALEGTWRSSSDPQQASDEQFRVARQTAQLQSDILEELLSMRDEDRSVKLHLARETAEQVLQAALQIPIMSDRIAFMTTLDVDKQRLMAMHKIWNGALAENGGIPPTGRN